MININAGAFIIFDDANSITKTDLMPVAVENDFRAGLAIFHSGLASSYEYVTLPEAQDWCKRINGEILNHSMNSVVLASNIDCSYRDSLIESSQREFAQMGFATRGFVAPSSKLAPDSKCSVINVCDYAFLRSAKFTTNAGAVNAIGADRWNMVRISLEPSDSNPSADMTLERAKQFVDYANETGGYICFYTHKYLDWIPALMQYIKENCQNITPTEWVGKHYGLSKCVGVHCTQNLINNSIADLGWKLDTTELSGVVTELVTTMGVDLLAIRALGKNPSGSSGYLKYTYHTGPIKVYTPICFSINASSMLPSNTRLILNMSLIDKNGNIIRKSPEKQYVISANRPTVYINDGFCIQGSKEVDADNLLIELKFEAIEDGQVVVILHSPKLEKSGLPTPV